MYTKDIAFLLRLLGASKQSGVLFVEAPGPLPSPWLGQFHLDNGQVTSCALFDKTEKRIVLKDEEALRWLMSQGKIAWRLEEASPLPALPPPPHENPPHEEEVLKESSPSLPWKSLPAVPQRTEKGKVVPANAFASREHRQIFALVDGHRTVDEIAQLLQRPSDAVLRVLQELQAAGFVV